MGKGRGKNHADEEYKSPGRALKWWYIYGSYSSCKGDEKIPENGRS